MAVYMEALSAHAVRQQQALRQHDIEAEVRENRWISLQLEQGSTYYGSTYYGATC